MRKSHLDVTGKSVLGRRGRKCKACKVRPCLEPPRKSKESGVGVAAAGWGWVARQGSWSCRALRTTVRILAFPGYWTDLF